MDPKAIAEATLRLDRARAAIGSFESHALNYSKIETDWWTFLLAANAIYTKLEQGANANPKSRAWFGRVKHIRKTDPLLSYLHQARNSDEHGLDPTAVRDKGDIEVIEGGTVIPPSAENPRKTIQLRVGVPFKARVIAPGIKLVPVTNTKFGDTFQPPTAHLGKPIDDKTPLGVARLALAYLENLIAEAAKLPT